MARRASRGGGNRQFYRDWTDDAGRCDHGRMPAAPIQSPPILAPTPLAHLHAALAEVAARRVCFVGGQGKSGTTWVQLLLGGHPQVSAGGEALLTESLAAPLYALCGRYAEALARNNASFPELAPVPALDGADTDALAHAALALALARLARARPAASVLAERTPANIGRIAELRALFPGACFVHVLRDPRDVAVSLWHHGERLAPGSMARQHGDPAGLARTLLPHWARLVAAARAQARDCGAPVLELRYEDLLEAPRPTASRLFGFLGVDASDRLVAAAIAASDFEAVSGRRRGEAAASHFRSGTSGGWRAFLAGWDERALDPETSAVMASLGYAPSPAPNEARGSGPA